MKAFMSLLLLAAVAAAIDYDTECPSEQEDDWDIEKLLRHEDCEKYYQCTLGKPIERICPANLWFNLDKWECDYPKNVDCTGRNEPTLPPPTSTTPEPTTTTTTTTTPPPTTTTTTTTTTTPPPTTTTTTTTTTTPPPTTTTTTTTTTTPPPTTTTTTTPTPETSPTEPGFNKNGCPINPHIHWLLPHESNCNLFYYCVWGEKVLRQCPSPLHFNKVIQVCDYSHNAGCSTSFDKNAQSRREILLGY